MYNYYNKFRRGYSYGTAQNYFFAINMEFHFNFNNHKRNIHYSQDVTI